MKKICWTEYLKYRTKLRGFDISIIEDIIKHTNERYYDDSTQRIIAIGKHEKILVMIPYELDKHNVITPVTIHAINRQQINYRIKCGRFKYE